MSNEGGKKTDGPDAPQRQGDEDPLTRLEPRRPAQSGPPGDSAAPSAPAERPRRGNGSATMAGTTPDVGSDAGGAQGAAADANAAPAGADGGGRHGSGAHGSEADGGGADDARTDGRTDGGTGGATGESGAAEPAAAEATPEAALDAMRGELREQQERYLRLHAEFENTKKRMHKEHGESLRYALTPLVTEVAAVLDNLERAVEHARKEQGEAVVALLAGIEMVMHQMQEALGRFGVTRIAAAGKPFDPAMHEAMTVVETDDVPENQVLQEFQAGYLLHDRVVRPARVSVSKRATGADAPAETAGG